MKTVFMLRHRTMWAVCPSEGFLDDALAIFKKKADAEYFLARLNRVDGGCDYALAEANVVIDNAVDDV